MSDETFNPTNELEHARMRQSQQEYLALESQNQALQERIEELEKGLRNITSGIDHHPTRSNDAHDADRLYSFIQSALGIVDQRAKQLLSPTQETDPG
jgi:Tat protein secretion system quality control protein TatD with DNase activity